MRTRVIHIIKKFLTLTILLSIITSGLSSASIKKDQVKTPASSKYLGCLDIKLTEGTGFFDVAQDENGVWWFVTPEGNIFYSMGLNCVLADQRPEYTKSILEKYGNYENWANAQLTRYKNWNYNTLGAWCDLTLLKNIPYTYQIKTFGEEDLLVARKLPDIWNPEWREMVRIKVENETSKFRNDPYLIGYWIDNEVNWGPDIFDKNTLLEEFITLKYEGSENGKLYTVEFLRERYQNNVKKFNLVWNMNLKSFDELYTVTDLGKHGWLAQHFPSNRRLKEDIHAFNEYVAETYFNYTTTLIRKNDPNHLILGVRFHSWGTPKEIIESCGKYCDVLSVNYYRYARTNNYELMKYIQCFLYGCVPLDNWMKQYYEIGHNKPIIVGEFGYAAVDSGQKKQMGAAKLLLSQRDRADYFQWYAKKCFKSPYVIGYHWFSFVDKIKKDVDTNVGVVNIYDEEYNLLVNRMAEINSLAYSMHSES